MDDRSILHPWNLYVNSYFPNPICGLLNCLTRFPRALLFFDMSSYTASLPFILIK